MRLLIVVLLFTALLPSCSDRPTGPRPETAPGQLVVYISLDRFLDREQGSSGKRVQVLEAGVEGVTDSSGIVEFALESGAYTIRAHGRAAPTYRLLTKLQPSGVPRPFALSSTIAATA